MPCPISDLFTRMVTMFCRLMRMKALGAKSPAVVAAPAAGDWARTGRRKPSRMPPESAAVPRKSRREGRSAISGPLSHAGRRLLDRRADALIGAAATDIPAHGRVDVGIRRVSLLGEQGGRAHDLPALAVAALRHVLFDEGLLHRVQA